MLKYLSLLFGFAFNCGNMANPDDSDSEDESSFSCDLSSHWNVNSEQFEVDWWETKGDQRVRHVRTFSPKKYLLRGDSFLSAMDEARN